MSEVPQSREAEAIRRAIAEPTATIHEDYRQFIVETFVAGSQLMLDRSGNSEMGIRPDLTTDGVGRCELVITVALKEELQKEDEEDEED